MSDNDEGRQPMILQYVFILPGSYIPCLFPCALFDDIFPPSLAPCFLYEFYKKKHRALREIWAILSDVPYIFNVENENHFVYVSNILEPFLC